MNALTECAGALAVDHTHVENPGFPAFAKILGKQVADLGRSEGVEVEFRLDRDAVWRFIHRVIIFALRACGEGIFRFPRPSRGHNPPARQQWWP